MTNNINAQDIVYSDRDISFPTSVVEFFEGRLGQPTGGFPKDVQDKLLRGATASTERPGANLPPVALDKIKLIIEERISRPITNEELMSYLMYPDVFIKYAEHRKKYDDVSVIPTESEVTYYAVDKMLSEKIQVIAHKRGVTADTLINLWVQEKLQE